MKTLKNKTALELEIVLIQLIACGIINDYKIISID